MINLKSKMKLTQVLDFLINSEFLNNLKVPEESIFKTIDILEDKKIGKNRSILG